MKNYIIKSFLSTIFLLFFGLSLKAQDAYASVTFIKGTPSADGTGYVLVTNNTFTVGENDIYIRISTVNLGSPAIPASKARPQLSIGGTGFIFDGNPVIYQSFNLEAATVVPIANTPILNQSSTTVRFQNTSFAIPAYESLDIFVKVIPQVAGNYTPAVYNITWNGPAPDGNLTGNDGASTGNIVINAGSSYCYKPGVTSGTALDSKMGITALGRAGAADADNWPMVRKGGWIVLESKTKGFVMNRLTVSQINALPAANLVEGMIVYDTDNKCLKIYTTTDGTNYSWQCINTQTCPD